MAHYDPYYGMGGYPGQPGMMQGAGGMAVYPGQQGMMPGVMPGGMGGYPGQHGIMPGMLGGMPGGMGGMGGMPGRMGGTGDIAGGIGGMPGGMPGDGMAGAGGMHMGQYDMQPSYPGAGAGGMLAGLTGGYSGAAMGGVGGPMCAQGHRMVVEDYREGIYVSGWSCDKCARSQTMGQRWRCGSCGSDVCFTCIPQQQQQQSGGDPMSGYPPAVGMAASMADAAFEVSSEESTAPLDDSTVPPDVLPTMPGVSPTMPGAPFSSFGFNLGSQVRQSWPTGGGQSHDHFSGNKFLGTW